MDTSLNYLLVLKSEQVAILKGKNIDPILFDQSNSIYSFAGKNIDDVMKILNLEYEGTSNSNLVGYVYLKCHTKTEKKEINVNVIQWSGNLSSKHFVPTCKRLAPILDKDINLEYCAGKYKKPQDNGYFNILIRSTPNPNLRANYYPPNSLWGNRTSRTKYFFYSGMGIPIYEEKQGIIVGEIIDDNVYFYFDLTNADHGGPIKIFEHFIDKVKFILEVDSKTYQEYLNDIKIKQKENFVKKELAKLSEDKQIQRNNFYDNHYQTDSTGRELIQSLIYLKNETKQFKSWITMREKIEQELLNDFQAIKKQTMVRNVSIQDTTLIIQTNCIYCYNPLSNTKHEIGEFLIKIGIFDCRIQLFNISRKIDAYYAKMNGPHIDHYGQPFDDGFLQNIINNLAGKKKFFELVKVLISFIESVNVNSAAGKHIDKWPPAA